MLNINRRKAKLGPKVIGSNDDDAEDFKPHIGFTLAEIELSEKELNALLRVPQADSAFFSTSGRGRSLLSEPRFPMLAAFELKKAVKGARVQVWLDSSPSKLSTEFGVTRETFYRILQRRGVRRP